MPSIFCNSVLAALFMRAESEGVRMVPSRTFPLGEMVRVTRTGRGTLLRPSGPS